MDDLCVRGERCEVTRDTVIETRTDRNEQVRLLECGDSRHVAVHAGHAHVLRVGVRERAAGHERRGHRNLRCFSQAQQLCGSAGADDTAADVEHRLLGLRDQLRGFANLLIVRLGDGTVAGQAGSFRPHERSFGLLSILGHVHQNGAGPAGRGDVERRHDCLRDVFNAGHQERVLGDGHCHAHDVRFLERVGAEHLGGLLAGDCNQRHGVHVSIGNRSDEVRGTGAGGRHAHADFSSGGRVAGCRMSGTLFVADEDVVDGICVHQRVIGREDGSARQSEYGVDAHQLKAANDGLCARQDLGGSPPSFGGLLSLARRRWRRHGL